MSATALSILELFPYTVQIQIALSEQISRTYSRVDVSRIHLLGLPRRFTLLFHGEDEMSALVVKLIY